MVLDDFPVMPSVLTPAQQNIRLKGIHLQPKEIGHFHNLKIFGHVPTGKNGYF